MISAPRFFIQFAGQGMKYMDELGRLYRTVPTLRQFIRRAVEVINREADSYDDSESRFFTRGLDVIDWIEQPEHCPDFSYLMSSPVSHPLIYLCQISNFLALIHEGLDHSFLLENTVAGTGFSTGIMAALLGSLRLPAEQVEQRALLVQAVFFWQGVRCQQSILKRGVRPVLSASLHATPKGSPSCMVSITDIPRSRLDRLIDDWSGAGVHLAYKMTPTRCSIAGLPDELSAFSRYLDDRGVVHKWRYVPSTIAAHSPLLDHAYETTPKDARRLGLSFSGDELAFPVLSNDTGTDLRESMDIVDDVMKAYFLKTGFFRRQIAPLFSGEKITHVLDFGPGAGLAGLTESHAGHLDVKVIRCAIPLERKMLLKTIASFRK